MYNSITNWRRLGAIALMACTVLATNVSASTVQLGFEEPITSSAALDIILNYEGIPAAVFVSVAGVNSTFRAYDQRSAINFMFHYKDEALLASRDWIYSNQVKIKSIIHCAQEKYGNQEARNILLERSKNNKMRDILVVIKQAEIVLAAIENDDPIIYGLEMTTNSMENYSLDQGIRSSFLISDNDPRLKVSRSLMPSQDSIRFDSIEEATPQEIYDWAKIEASAVVGEV